MDKIVKLLTIAPYGYNFLHILTSHTQRKSEIKRNNSPIKKKLKEIFYLF